MLVSLEWIKDFVDLSAPTDEIAHRLTMAGLEVEGIQPHGADVLMEINVTPNRPDCLNMLGVAREAAAVFRLPLRLPDTDVAGTTVPSDIRVVIDAPELCARYAGRTIRNVKVGESPSWLRQRLEKCGIRSINNIVDITNYVLLELGHPLHAFDANALSGKLIRVARAGDVRTIRTLDGVDRPLSADTLLIWDAAKPVAIAGIMGGEGSAVTGVTTDVFLESAYFLPQSIRKSSKHLALKSESAYRFERGTDKVFLMNALNRASLLMAEVAGGTICDVVEEYPVPFMPVRIEVPYHKVSSLIGVDITKDDIRSLLDRIGICSEDRGAILVAVPPSHRGDITDPVDVIEEIARCFGYDNIPARKPKAVLSGGAKSKEQKWLKVVREAVRGNGYTEVVNFSFMNSADLDLLNISEDRGETRRKHVRLKNPLRQEECLMRTTLLPALVRNFQYNHSRGIRDVRLFELSRVFIDWGKELPNEGLRLAGICFQDNAPALWKESVPAFYRVKGLLEALFEEMRIMEYRMVPSREAFLHPGKSGDILLGETVVGYIGELAPGVVELLDVKTQKPQIVVFEVDMDALISLAADGIHFRQIPRFPSIERDVSLIIDDQITAFEVADLVRKYPSPLIESVELFDIYKGKHIDENRKSVGVRIVYRSDERTLTEAEVENVHQAVIDHAKLRIGASVRGLH